MRYRTTREHLTDVSAPGVARTTIFLTPALALPDSLGIMIVTVSQEGAVSRRLIRASWREASGCPADERHWHHSSRARDNKLM